MLVLCDAAVVGAAVTFLIAAGFKFADPNEFAKVLARQHGVAMIVPLWIAVGAAILQLLLGVLPLWLLLMCRRSAACIVTAAAMALMTSYAAWMALTSGSAPAPCGCGFSERLYHTADWQHAAAAQCLMAVGFGALAIGMGRAPRDLSAQPALLGASSPDTTS